MTPDRRKMLRGMAAAMAAAGVGGRTRVASAAMTESRSARLIRVGTTLTTGGTSLNPLFQDPTGLPANSPNIVTTAGVFKNHFGPNGAGYTFGQWIPWVNDHYAELNLPKPPLTSSVDVSDWTTDILTMQIRESQAIRDLTQVVLVSLLSNPLVPTTFSSASTPSGTGSHVYTITYLPSNKPTFQAGDVKCKVTMVCPD